MKYLGLLFILAQLAANLWGLMLVAGLYWRNRWFALVAAPILGVTVMFSIECFHGLGPALLPLGLLSTLLSGTLVGFSLSAWVPGWMGPSTGTVIAEWRAEFAPSKLVGCFGVFCFIFLYALYWRYMNPNLYGGTEAPADFSYICSYYSGTTIPVVDAWYYPFPSTQYYSFQHYAAALMGRLLVLPRGTAYNIGFCLLIALAGTAYSGVVFILAKRVWVRALLVAALLVGGTGMVPIAHLTETDVTPMISFRYIGLARMDKAPFGPWLKAYKDRHAVRTDAGPIGDMGLPAEPFAFSILLGDYHAPLSGYYLLGLSAMAMLLWTRLRLLRYAVIVGCCLTWTVLSNTWDLPLQLIMTVAWLTLNFREGRRLIPAVAVGAGVIWLAASVYLNLFTAAGSGTGAAFRWVPWHEHTPPLIFVLFHLPTLVLIALGVASGDSMGRRFAVLWLALLVFTEFVYLDSVYMGVAARTNSTLKWWPWITTGALMSLAPLVLEQAKRRWIRVAGAVCCLYPCMYAYDLWPWIRDRPCPSSGYLEGNHFLMEDEYPRLMYMALKVEKPGVVAERPDVDGGFTDAGILPLFADKQMWLGWAGHELLWRSFQDTIRRRQDALLLLYSGDMPQAGKWLQTQHIDYVLWYRKADTPELWDKVSKSIGPNYEWCDLFIYQNAGLEVRRLGYWRRLPSAGI